MTNKQIQNFVKEITNNNSDLLNKIFQLELLILKILTCNNNHNHQSYVQQTKKTN